MLNKKLESVLYGDYIGTLSYLAGQINKRKVKTVVEIGVDRGIGCIILHSCFPEAQYHGFDMNIQDLPLKLECNNVCMHQVDTMSIKSMEYDIDVAYIDGDHSYEGCLHDLNIVSESLTKNGVIIMHDFARESGTVRKAFVDWLQESKETWK